MQNARDALNAAGVGQEAKRSILALSNIAAVQKIETLLERESAVAEDAEGLVKQLEALHREWKDSAIADAVKNREGPAYL